MLLTRGIYINNNSYEDARTVLEGHSKKGVVGGHRRVLWAVTYLFDQLASSFFKGIFFASQVTFKLCFSGLHVNLKEKTMINVFRIAIFIHPECKDLSGIKDFFTGRCNPSYIVRFSKLRKKTKKDRYYYRGGKGKLENILI